MNKRLGGRQSRSGRSGEERDVFLAPDENQLTVLDRSAFNLAVALPITVHRTVALPLVLYGCETEFAVLKREQKFMDLRKQSIKQNTYRYV